MVSVGFSDVSLLDWLEKRTAHFAEDGVFDLRGQHSTFFDHLVVEVPSGQIEGAIKHLLLSGLAELSEAILL